MQEKKKLLSKLTQAVATFSAISESTPDLAKNKQTIHTHTHTRLYRKNKSTNLLYTIKKNCGGGGASSR